VTPKARTPTAAKDSRKAPAPADRELNRDEIISAALRLIERVGVDKLTMRALATELDYSPMATYRHVANRDELLLLAADSVLGRVVVPPRQPGDPWESKFIAIAEAVWEQLQHARWIPGFLMHRNVSCPSHERILAELGEILAEAGLSADERRMATMMTWTFTAGLLSWTDEAGPYLRYGMSVMAAGIPGAHERSNPAAPKRGRRRTARS
jgi:AcrR family transcriptional regulator